MRPKCTLDNARLLAKELFGVEGEVRQLASYSDQNFLVGGTHVLKIANSSEPEHVLQFQQAALQHVHSQDPALNTPQVIPLVSGEVLGSWQEQHLVWMVNFIPGQFISDLDALSQSFLHSLGAYLGRLDHALGSFNHEAMHRDLQWDLQHAARLTDFVQYIDDPGRAGLIEKFIARFNTHVRPRFSRLRVSVIHNDANDNNILVNKEGTSIKGIIDFGDMVYTYTIGELAIAVAYMILGKESPLHIAGAVAKGYHSVYPLQRDEIEVLFDLVCMRLCTSVCMSAREKRKAPENEYLAISEAPAWNTLAQLAAMNPQQATRTLQDHLA